MVNINATTPQLQLVKKWMEGYHSLNMDNVEPHVSKNFKYQACFHTADEAKGEHSERYGKVLGSMTNLETDVHEVIEAPGKVVVHVTTKCSTVHGTTITKNCVCIFSIVEEDGELKIAGAKEFADSQGGAAWDNLGSGAPVV